MLKTLLLSLTLLGFTVAAGAQSIDMKREFPQQKLLDWKPGMRFQMPVKEASIHAECQFRPLKGPTFKGTDLYGEQSDDKKLAGTSFTFVGLQPFQDKGHDNQRNGYEKVAVVFKAANGKQYAYIINNTMAEVKSRGNFVGAPCLVYTAEVEKARKLLLGRTAYVLKSYIGQASTRDDVQYLPKFVPVKFTKVEMGAGLAPVRLTFEYVGVNPRQVQEQDYILSGTNSQLTYMGGKPLDNTFEQSFSFTDPRSQNSQSKDSNWKAIQQGTLVKGMSTREVEQIMGKPRSRSESLEEEGRFTTWYYSRFQGKEWNLLFVNDKLEKYVNYEN
ncbi:hypothetical protein [Hymenobacter actinosclerus]|uniref:SmpA / OmlA family protein n=1 Tax=Hymenobacter actinosclerus TaxID=82805 RepID=A0A1I0H146_9BACT|nr:hypothetical protein [Hymenobacter actinosclerus]SET76391.1 hypothetical protein SAMN04487998_2661 [Hymenobacter actinosclerus]